MNYYPAPHGAASPSAADTKSWHRIRPDTDDRRTSTLFWISVFIMGCVSHLCVTFGASIALAKKGAEKPLQVGVTLPKLKGSYGETKANAFRMSEPEPSELAHPKDRKATVSVITLPVIVDQSHGRVQELPAVPLATHEPPPVAADLLLNSPPRFALTPQPSSIEMCNEPVIYLQPCTPPRGDSPMIHNWKTLTLYSLLSAATVVYAPQPIIAGGTDPKEKPSTDALEKLSINIQALTKRIAELEKRPATFDQEITNVIRTELGKLEKGMLAELQAIAKSVDTLKMEMAAIQTEQLKQKFQADGAKIQIDQLTAEIRDLRKKQLTDSTTVLSQTPALDRTSLDEIRSRLNAIQDAIARIAPSEKRLSMSMPNGTAANTGRVMLVNLYSDEVLFMINGTSYRVPPRSQKSLENVPTGSLNYEVMASRWGLLDRQTTTLASGETFTLTAR